MFIKLINYFKDKLKEYILIIKYKGKSHYIVEELRKRGAQIGRGVQLYSEDIFIDPTRPWLLTIGEYTKITHHVIILTHDYSLSVLRRRYGEWIGEGRETIIGNNCFIGMNSVILMGAHIGNNVIVAAGSVVSGSFPDDVVIGGCPAKIICTLEEHYQRRKERTREEAIECARLYIQRFGKEPTIDDMGGFKWLFLPRDKKTLESMGITFHCTGDEPEEVEKAFYETQPYWNSFEHFINEVKLSEEMEKNT